MTLENFHSSHTSARANNLIIVKYEQMFITVTCFRTVLKFQCLSPTKILIKNSFAEDKDYTDGEKTA